jgi:spore cortex biosynthesis protein YabQ
MEIHVAEQTLAFACACLMGALFGAVYDIFRVLRLAIPSGRVAVFLEDVAFFLFCAAAAFLFLLAENDGVIRAFLFAGEIIGAALYALTLSRLVSRGAKPVIGVVKGALRRIGRYILWPIWVLIYRIVELLFCPARFLWKIIKKSCQRLIFRLKTVRVVLYNHCKGRKK